MKNKKEEIFSTGSGNIFQDFGFTPEEASALTIKASMFRSLQKALKETGKTQTELTKTLGIPQPKISDILNGKIAGFSVERLAQLLIRLNYEICLDIHPAPSGCDGRVIMLQNTQAV